MKYYIRLILILAIPLGVALLYAASDLDLGLESINLEGFDMNLDLNADVDLGDEVEAEEEDEVNEEYVPVDSTHKRVLFFGDSMVEGLCVRMADYARENGYELYGVSWYASTTVGWAAHLDSLRNWLAWSNADFVMVSMGGNELETKDTKRRTECVEKIMEVIGDRPCVWIGTPSWVPNPTITDIERKAVGNRRFFDSNRLKLKRAPDHMHPTYPAYAQWMDSVAVWLESQRCETPIRMRKPTFHGSALHHMIVLDAHGKRKGQAAETEIKPEEEILPEGLEEPVVEPKVEPIETDSL